MKRLLPVLWLIAVAWSASAASVSGRISFVTKRGQSPIAQETLVWLEPVGGTKAPRQSPVTSQMVTKGKALLPHVLAIPVGSTVKFPNEDPISHNLFSLTSGNQFDLGLYRTGAGKAQTFSTPGIVNVYCNVHPGMSAVVHVLATPWYAFADQHGNFTLPDVPPGRYELVTWNEQGGPVRMPLSVPAAGSNSIVVTMDSRGYRSSSHMNKDGRAYEPPRAREY